MSSDISQWTVGQWKKYLDRSDLTREMHDYESASESTDTEISSEGDSVFDRFVHPRYLEQKPIVRDMPRLNAMRARLDGQSVAGLRRAVLARNVEECGGC